MRSRWLTLFQTPVAYYSIFLVIFLMVLVLGLFLAKRGAELHELPVRAYNTYHCVTMSNEAVSPDPGGSGGEVAERPTFRIMDVFHLGASSVADMLCQDSEFGRNYARVEVAWVNRDQIDLRRLFQKHYDLLIAKPEIVQRVDALGSSTYVPIAHYANYSSQLIAFGSQPELNNNYFRGKKLGLLDDPNSLSGYQIPKSALKRAEIDPTIFEIHFFKSHLQLYEALHKGEVDLIASFRWSEFDGQAEAAVEKVLRLQSQLPGPRWYLHPERLDSVGHCVVLQALKKIAVLNANTYLEGLTIVRDCVDG